MGPSFDNKAASTFCGRLALLLKGKAFLIVDRIVTTHPARIEARLHTHAEVHGQIQGACLRGKREKLRLAFAANVPSLLVLATTAPTTPTAEPAQVLRWCRRALHKNMVLITLAVPGTGPAGISLKQAGRVLKITIKARPLTMQLDVSEDLEVLHVR